MRPATPSRLLPLALAAACLASRAPAQTSPLTITVQPGARQTFGGFGAGGLNFGREYQTLTSAQRQALSGRLRRGLNFKTLRLWFSADQYAPTSGAHDLSQFRGCYVDSGLIADARRNGVTTLLLAPDGPPPYMAEKSAAGSADTGMALKEADVVPDVTGVQNEPNDRERFTPAQLASVQVSRFAVRRSGSGVNDAPAGFVAMHNGAVTFPAIRPLELITLRPLPATKKE